jgi:acetamidase/formamidase
VEGAEPGDALKVTIEEFHPSGFGWTANIPGFGLLADQFTEPALTLWKYDPQSLEPALFGSHGRVPLKPFAGTIGCAPAEAGQHSVVPPRRVGGNLDIRDLSAGTVLYLPVEVEGALFSVGDTHAAQGDGEVCGTAIESAMNVELTLDLVKDARLKFPRFSTPGPVTRHLDAKGYEVTTGIGADLMEGARHAVADMVELLSARYGLNPVDAYMLVSTCADLRISEIVDMPNWVVSFYFPRMVFE